MADRALHEGTPHGAVLVGDGRQGVIADGLAADSQTDAVEGEGDDGQGCGNGAGCDGEQGGKGKSGYGTQGICPRDFAVTFRYELKMVKKNVTGDKNSP